MSSRGEGTLLAVLCLVLYLTGLGDVEFHTRGEPREALVAREVLRTGSWLVPTRPNGELARKPPLFHWAAAAALGAFPDRQEFAARLPSALSATLAVGLTWLAARTAWGAAAGLPAAVVLATAFEWTRAATSARVDMMLAAALTVVLASLVLTLARGGRRWTVAAAIGIAAATLAKGPIGLLLPALVGAGLAVVRRDPSVLGRLRLLPALAGGAAVALAWYVAAYARLGDAFLEVVARENWGRFLDTTEAGTGHAHGPVYLAFVGLVGLLPWTPLLPLGASAFAGDARRHEPTALAATWSVVVAVFFGVAASKRSVYLLPLFPALALLAGAAVQRDTGVRIRRWVVRATVVYVPALVLLAAAAVGLAAGLDPTLLIGRWLEPTDALGAEGLAGAAREAAPRVLLVATGTLFGAAALDRARRRADWRTFVLVLGAMMAVWTILFDTVALPAIARTRSLRSFMTRVDRVVPHLFSPPCG